MSRVYDYAVVSVIFIVSVVIHLMSAEIFLPGTPLYEMATSGTEVMDGQQFADRVSMILTVWVPLIATSGAILWALIREYRRQALSAVQRVGGAR